MNFSSARNSLKSFAHLLGNTSAAKGKKIEDDEEDETMNHEDVPAEDKEDGKKAEKEKEEEKASREEEKEKEEEKASKKKASKKKGVKDEGEEEREEEEEEVEAEEEEEETDEEKRAYKRGKKAERARCAAIFGSQHASGRADLAASLAFNTGLSASAAIKVLASSSISPSVAPARKSLASRMDAAPNYAVGTETSASSGKMNAADANALRVINAGRKARGEALLTKLD